MKIFIWYFFDWRGRIGRLSFLAGHFGVLIASGVLEIVAHPLPLLVFSIIALAILVDFALESKRLHDMGRSALWILWMNYAFTFWSGFTLIAMIPWSSLQAFRETRDPAEHALILHSLGRWALVGFIPPALIKLGWLVLGRGTTGYNGYDFPDQIDHFSDPAAAPPLYQAASPPSVASRQTSEAHRNFGRKRL